jgi:hypothetical protein
MRSLFWIGIVVLIVASGCSSESESESTSKKEHPDNGELPNQFEGIPIGIEVTHTPDVVYPTPNTKDPEKRGKFQWVYNTSVKSTVGDLEIIEFSAYSWVDGKWVSKTVYGRPFNNEEFAKWYSCENGILKDGQTYSDPDNWSGKSDNPNAIEHTKGVWYYIGKDQNGKQFLGYAFVNTYGQDYGDH